jgi:hypothetical protein
MSPARPVSLTAAILALTFGSAALAQQPPASANGAVGAALGSAAQPKLATPPPAPVVTPGAGEDPAVVAAARAAALAAAIASGDTRKALEAGATAADMIRMAQAAGVTGPIQIADPELAVFVRGPNGSLALGYSGPGAYFVYFPASYIGFEPPGGLASLPTLAERFGPPPPPQPPPMTTAVGQLFAAGLPATDVGKAVLTAAGIGSPLYELDTRTAKFVQTPDGGVGVAMTKTGGAGLIVSPIPGSNTYPGRAALPTAAQAFPPPASAAPRR